MKPTRYKCASRTFNTIEEAKAHAEHIFRTKKIIVGIEKMSAPRKFQVSDYTH
jgi:hypothetical protein